MLVLSLQCGILGIELRSSGLQTSILQSPGILSFVSHLCFSLDCTFMFGFGQKKRKT